MNQPAALIFDCDGTLADTMPVHFLAWQEAIKPAGLTFDEDHFYRLGGVPTDKIFAMLCEEQNKTADVDKLSQTKEAAYEALIHQVKPIEAIVAVARENHGRIPLAVGSGGYRETVISTLKTIGILELFDHIVAAEDTQRHKPEPDVYLRAAELLGVAPTACRVYEDTDLGLEAGFRAGMRCFDVRAVHTPKRWT
ncbi:MAG: HAD family hydrolase [Planctomycetaceae bacterium]